MKRIISVSRRTDIPAFYGTWFMNRLRQGKAGYKHPYSREESILSLLPEDVVCFVFWSKNFIHFTGDLKEIKQMGFNFYFNYTITGLPGFFEPGIPEKTGILENMKLLSDTYSPETINWRYDPIIISNKTDAAYHIEQFRKMAVFLRGYVKRCYFSFMTLYHKIEQNIHDLEQSNHLYVNNPALEDKIRLVNILSEIADNNNMTLYSCCDIHLVDEKIKKAHCIDGELIQSLFSIKDFNFESGATRKNCGCTKSSDIGVYDSCPHECLYCYANTNWENVHRNHTQHDPCSLFL